MPLPNIEEEKITREELIERYLQTGWTKKLVFDWVEVDGRTKRPMLKRYEFNADTMPCGNRECIPYMATFVQLRPTGVIWTCASCRKTDGPIAIENGRELQQYTRQLTIEEAWNIIGDTGQYPPVGLEQPPKGRRYQILT
jgi:hypothetical protein